MGKYQDICNFAGEMNSGIKQKIQQSLVIILIGAFGFILANNIIFQHTHKSEDGRTIVHAHPFNKSAGETPGESHHHSKTELILYEKVLQLFSILIIPLVLLILSFATHHFIRNQFISSQGFTLFICGRAPPVY